jgi:hypothetical protein
MNQSGLSSFQKWARESQTKTPQKKQKSNQFVFVWFTFVQEPLLLLLVLMRRSHSNGSLDTDYSRHNNRR